MTQSSSGCDYDSRLLHARVIGGPANGRRPTELALRSAPVRIRVLRLASAAGHGPYGSLVPWVGDGAPDRGARHAEQIHELLLRRHWLRDGKLSRFDAPKQPCCYLPVGAAQRGNRSPVPPRDRGISVSRRLIKCWPASEGPNCCLVASPQELPHPVAGMRQSGRPQ